MSENSISVETGHIGTKMKNIQLSKSSKLFQKSVQITS